MSLAQSLNFTQKQTPKLSMKMWLPILQCATSDLNSFLTRAAEENPFLDIKIKAESATLALVKKCVQKSGFEPKKSSISDSIERMAISGESLYETLFNQIEAPLFPTEFSQKIAHEIIENINEDGFFEGSVDEIAKKLETNPHDVENIRQRFAFLEPVGVGAVDFKESFLFQIMDLELDDELNSFTKSLIFDFDNIQNHASHPLFEKARSIIKRLKNPPAIDYFEESRAIIPEVIVTNDDEGIKVSINSACYPDVSIKNEIKGIKGEFGTEKKKEAKRIAELLGLRKNTLLNIAQFIARRQVGFFFGSELSPLAMREVAEEFGYSQSTISRAIAGKYLQCERGVFALKSMFAYTIGENVSNESIKRFIYETIQNENKQKPLSDEKILSIVNERFHVNLVRRSITKYRLEMGLGSSTQRKSA